ncbi:MAG: hypothetical protein U1C59_13850 [Methylotenera sp.]|nr:hypothetical protein [Methylotenera sp.]
MNATREQIKAFRASLASRKLQDMKDELVLQFSGERTTHSTELTITEMRQLLTHLNGEPDDRLQKEKENRQRRRIMSMCYTLGWTKYDDNIKREVVDFARLDAWVDKYGYLKKPMMKYDYRELPKLVTQFENMLKSTLQ